MSKETIAIKDARIMRLIYIIWQEWKMPGEIMSKQNII